mmetsp:Transcript_51070/g.159581  ORF Transcript_51070/g.159581 Transcript_51070/m.159581 type:complete len:257 (-) Transcript_51070:1000-1770(-)
MVQEMIRKQRQEQTRVTPVVRRKTHRPLNKILELVLSRKAQEDTGHDPNKKVSLHRSVRSSSPLGRVWISSQTESLMRESLIGTTEEEGVCIEIHNLLILRQVPYMQLAVAGTQALSDDFVVRRVNRINQLHFDVVLLQHCPEIQKLPNVICKQDQDISCLIIFAHCPNCSYKRKSSEDVIFAKYDGHPSRFSLLGYHGRSFATSVSCFIWARFIGRELDLQLVLLPDSVRDPVLDQVAILDRIQLDKREGELPQG